MRLKADEILTVQSCSSEVKYAAVAYCRWPHMIYMRTCEQPIVHAEERAIIGIVDFRCGVICMSINAELMQD